MTADSKAAKKFDWDEGLVGRNFLCSWKACSHWNADFVFCGTGGDLGGTLTCPLEGLSPLGVTLGVGNSVNMDWLWFRWASLPQWTSVRSTQYLELSAQGWFGDGRETEYRYRSGGVLAPSATMRGSIWSKSFVNPFDSFKPATIAEVMIVMASKQEVSDLRHKHQDRWWRKQTTLAQK